MVAELHSPAWTAAAGVQSAPEVHASLAFGTHQAGTTDLQQRHAGLQTCSDAQKAAAVYWHADSFPSCRWYVADAICPPLVLLPYTRLKALPSSPSAPVDTTTPHSQILRVVNACGWMPVQDCTGCYEDDEGSQLISPNPTQRG